MDETRCLNVNPDRWLHQLLIPAYWWHLNITRDKIRGYKILLRLEICGLTKSNFKDEPKYMENHIFSFLSKTALLNNYKYHA